MPGKSRPMSPASGVRVGERLGPPLMPGSKPKPRPGRSPAPRARPSMGPGPRPKPGAPPLRTMPFPVPFDSAPRIKVAADKVKPR